MKDNVFALEKGIKEKTRLYFDKDLEQTRVLLAEQKAKFKEYQLSLITTNGPELGQLQRPIPGTIENCHQASPGLATVLNNH